MVRVVFAAGSLILLLLLNLNLPVSQFPQTPKIKIRIRIKREAKAGGEGRVGGTGRYRRYNPHFTEWFCTFQGLQRRYKALQQGGFRPHRS